MKPVLAFAALTVALGGCQKSQTQSHPTSAAPTTAALKRAEPVNAALETKRYDGPFGLAGGIPVAELEKMGFTPINGSPGLYVGKPPRPLQDADEYTVVAAPTSGVCRIVAHVQVPVVNGTGDQLKTRTDRLADAMQIKYGKYSTKVDYIGQDVYRRNPEYWMMGLKEESVFYAYDWTAGKTAQPLPGLLEGIEISADTTNLDSGYVSLKYTFNNFKECRKELETRKADNL